MTDKNTFEKAYERLEQILQKMTAQNVSLADSVALYKESDALIRFCQKELAEAEQTIEVLLKQKDGNLSLDVLGNPQTEPFTKETSSILKS